MRAYVLEYNAGRACWHARLDSHCRLIYTNAPDAQQALDATVRKVERDARARFGRDWTDPMAWSGDFGLRFLDGRNRNGIHPVRQDGSQASIAPGGAI